jgi:hypothetical protein
MKNSVTVIPIDRSVYVDGICLIFDFTAPDNLHALQWHGSSGHIEYTDGSANSLLKKKDYDSEVAPYVALWEAEKIRLDEESERPLLPEEIRQARITEIRARLDEIDLESIRPLRAIADNTATDSDREKLARLEEEAASLRAELGALLI